MATKIASGRDEVIESMKHALSHRIEEWLGSDIPAEGTEDFDAWQSKLANVEEIRSYSDIKAYVENECMDLAEFLASGDWDLEQLDLMPDELPIDYVIEKGTEIAQQSLQGGSWVNIYEYRGQFFVVGETGHEVFGSAEEAFRKAGIGRETNDKISNALVSHNYRHLLA